MRKTGLLIIFIFLFLSCGKIKGEFAFQTPEDKGYKINQSRFEFDSTKEINWIFKLHSLPRHRINLGVIILKKEIGWIDILTTTDYVDPKKDIVYGVLKGFDPGDYKIVLVEVTPDGNKTIDEKEVYIYSDEEVLD